MKYLLSTGKSTNQIEYYILDLIQLYLKIYPKDIPNLPFLGIDFILSDVKKDELVAEIRFRLDNMLKVIKSRLSISPTITITSIELISDSTAKVLITVGNLEPNVVFIDLSDN